MSQRGPDTDCEGGYRLQVTPQPTADYLFSRACLMLKAVVPNVSFRTCTSDLVRNLAATWIAVHHD